MPKINFSKFLEEREVSKKLEEEKSKNKMVEERLTMHNTGWGKLTPKHASSEPYFTKTNQKQLESNIN